MLFGLIDKKDRGKQFMLAKKKSPLLIGLGDDFNVVCSDAMAMLEQTNQFVEINDGEMVKSLQKIVLKLKTSLGNEIQHVLLHEAKN